MAKNGLCLLLLLALFLGIGGNRSLAQLPTASPLLTLEASGEEGLTFIGRAPEYALRYDAEHACEALEAPGLAPVDAAGWPALPVAGALFGLPYEAEGVTLEILEVEYRDLPGEHRLCPVPRPVWEPTVEGAPSYAGVAWERDPAAYTSEEFWPSDSVALVEEGYLRGQRVAQVAFYPFQYQAATGRLRAVQRVRARFVFAAGTMAQAAPAWPDAYAPLYQAALANEAQARAWRRPAGAESFSLAPQAEPSPWLKVVVQGRGMVRLTGADLAAAGVPIGEIAPHTLQIFWQGHPIARRLILQRQTGLSPEDVILFYSQGRAGQYTPYDVYQIRWGEGEGLDMGSEVSMPALGETPNFFWDTHVAREWVYYRSDLPVGPEADRWYWHLFLAYNQPVTSTLVTTLPALASEPVSATLRVLLGGSALSSAISHHHVRISLNGHLVGEAEWPALQTYIFETSVPYTYLQEGENTLTIAAGLNVGAGQWDYTWLNRFEVDYPRRYVAQDDTLFFSVDAPGNWLVHLEGFSGAAVPEVYRITDPLRPVRLTGATFTPGENGYTLSFGQSITQTERYLALTPARYLQPTSLELVTPTNWHDPSHGADYLIITHPDFYAAVQPLADYRRAQGLRVAVINVEDLYNEFNYGMVDAEAIRAFITYAYHHWQPPAPAYVLLVGDGNYDPKNYLGRGEVSYLPPYLADVDPWLGETAADNRYVAVHGEDIFPDLYLGRLPVKTADEAAAVVAKILAYEALGAEDWQRHLTFMADNADSAGNFPALSEAVASQYVPEPYEAERIYYGVTHSTASDARSALLNAFDEGRLLINWKGHSAVSSWASEQFLNLTYIAGLNNGPRQPLMVPMTCLEGYYITPSAPEGPDRSSLSEALVRLEGRGAIASFAPTGLGIATGHEHLNKGLFEALFFKGVNQLGPATTLAKLKLYSGTSSYRELIDTYLLMGDPALRLKVLETDLAIEKRIQPTGALWPGDVVTYTLTYTNVGPATAFGVVITDTLPAALENPTVTWAGATITPRVGSLYVWDVADLPAGVGGVITVTGQVRDDFLGRLDNTAQIGATVVESTPQDLISRIFVRVGLWRWLPVSTRP